MQPVRSYDIFQLQNQQPAAAPIAAADISTIADIRRILYSNYRQLGFFNQFGEFSSLAKFVSGSQEVASPIRLSCQVRAALFNNK